MREIFTLTIISGLLLIGFVTALILGVAKKKKKMILISVATFIFFLGVGSFTVFKFVSKSYNRVADIIKPRTGEEIYLGLFGKPQSGCLKVINKQDQVVPKIDYAIWLEFQTCPNELRRILSQKKFSREKQPSKALYYDQPSSNNNWFKPETLGDSILIYKYVKDDYGNGQTIYTSLDSTKAFCVDILD